MPRPKLRGLLDTYALNFRFLQWPKTVLEPFEAAATIVEVFHDAVGAIDGDIRLTEEGKREARVQAGKAAMEAITKWHTPRLAGLDADLGVHRAALLPTGEKPDARKVDYMLSVLQKHSPEEIATFYDKATDDERRVMEAASASVGRVPTKTANGLQWQPLLNPESVAESIAARATATNPQGAMKLRELEEIKAMHITVAGHALQEITDAVPDAMPKPELSIHTP